MNEDLPKVSVIIPSHNRCASLKRTLDGLALQTYPFHKIEVIVVADGCTDKTVEMLQTYAAPFALFVIEQPGQGAASARNQGAAKASGSLLLFLDDDIEPTTSLLEAHVRARDLHPGSIVMGPYFPIRQGQTDFARMNVRLWWYKKFETMQRREHRYTYRDLLSGNLSIDSASFTAMGGFDATIRSAGGEDYEFGARLIKSHTPFTFAPEALAYHHEHETMDLPRLFRRARQEGRAEVQIGRRHPDLRPTLGFAAFARTPSLNGFIGHALAFHFPGLGDRLASLLFLVLNVLERIRFWSTWQRVFARLHRYWYLRGVADELKSRRVLVNFLQGGPFNDDSGGPELEIDLSEGLVASQQKLDNVRPAAVRLRYREQVVGRIPPQSGAEPLRGAHLRPILATSALARSLIRAILLDGVLSSRRLPASFMMPQDRNPLWNLRCRT